jgi:hypothetical protein
MSVSQIHYEQVYIVSFYSYVGVNIAIVLEIIEVISQ